ncbi:hypothetical protein P6709_19815, partial [Jeotgalibacillus sp. ET6]|uniref:hypothetical protein n=1 Tax=Jeotgalibacillus sp. ET6 TaxID=3037260 RepID=UPI002418B132
EETVSLFKLIKETDLNLLGFDSNLPAGFRIFFTLIFVIARAAGKCNFSLSNSEGQDQIAEETNELLLRC